VRGRTLRPIAGGGGVDGGSRTGVVGDGSSIGGDGSSGRGGDGGGPGGFGSGTGSGVCSRCIPLSSKPRARASAESAGRDGCFAGGDGPEDQCGSAFSGIFR
jgi:hypothetical protein